MSRHVLEAAPAQALAALFDDGLDAPGDGEELPPLWHWVTLASWSPYGATGPDGHPRPLDLPPELRGRRRMFAGGRVTPHQPLHVGEHVEVEEQIVSITQKQGRQGDFALVELHSYIRGESGDLALEEVRDLVYRAPAQPGPSDAAGAPAGATGAPGGALLSRESAGWALRTDSVALMRFSAATANGHRIHYDWRYATQVEGYPDLVVHGPLMTLALAEVVRLERPAARLRELEHRNHRPLFCGQSARATLSERRGSRDLELALRHGDQQVATLQYAMALEP